VITVLSERPLIIVVDNALSAGDCQTLIEDSEERGFHTSTIISPKGPRVEKSIRNSDRVTWTSKPDAKSLWAKLGKLPHIRGWGPCGLNEFLRINRYDVGQQFRPHTDRSHERPDGEKSLLSVLFYLNDDFEGGQTWFETCAVLPRQGMAIAFDHDLLHAGRPVQSGRKYLLRSDVMYYPDPTAPPS